MVIGKPWRYLTGFLASTIAALFSVTLIGNFAGGRTGSYIPMLEHADFIRDEFVRRHAMTEVPNPCVAIFGDSRVAFNISAAVIENSLPSSCKAQNYGFATLSLHQIYGLLADMPPPDLAIISISETSLSLEDPVFAQRLLQNRLLRWLYLGHQRFLYLQQRMIGRRPPDTGWVWSSVDKRWQFSVLENLAFTSSAAHETTARSMSADYFANRDSRPNNLELFLANAATHTKRLVVLIPPSERRFQEISAVYGKQRVAWRHIANAAQSAKAILIDCSRGCVEEDGFADPVHLNKKGALSYSANLAGQIRGLSSSLAGRDQSLQ